MRTFTLAAVLLLAAIAPIAAALATPASVATIPTPCAGFTHIQGVGPACPVEGGFELVAADGSRIFTHGPDGPVLGHLTGAGALAPPAAPVCVDDPTQWANVLVYVRPVTAEDRHDALTDELRDMVALANGLLRQESALDGAPLDYRFRCDAEGEVLVREAVIPLPPEQTDFLAIATLMKPMGFASPFEKYWVWYDGYFPCGCAGVAELKRDNVLRPENQNNLGPSFAVTVGIRGASGAYVMMHESGHNLGAVSFQAPQTSGAGHCNDGLDIMCYDDGGPVSFYTSNACRPARWDCNRDTYFHAKPPENNWLARHWNLGSPFNRFLEGCARDTVVVTSQTPATVALDRACDGHRYGAFGTHGSVEAYRTCWADATGAALGCDNGNIFATDEVPAGAATATISVARGQGGLVMLSVF